MIRRGAWFAVMLALCLPPAFAQRQNGNSHRERPQARHNNGEMRRAERGAGQRSDMRGERQREPRSIPPRRDFVRPQTPHGREFRAPNRQFPPYPDNREMRRFPNNPNGAARPEYRGSPFPGRTYRQPAYPRDARPNYPRPNDPGMAAPRPAYPVQGAGQGNAAPNRQLYPTREYAPPGHLGAWLNQNRGVPLQQQEQQLRKNPNFNRLPQADQQRLVRQLHRMDQMPEAQRERRLARSEALERLSPEQRARVDQSARAWRSLPADRQAMMKGAFQDLRHVPPDQRQMVLNSGQYRNRFSPEERGILSNLLRVEPYRPPQ
ncbi:MAG TPA: DUF3106 domain-containing protein [Terracidiphilus sp.]|nr:DUF3106 domain-containing protein [Terracidiphilus sp.]